MQVKDKIHTILGYCQYDIKEFSQTDQKNDKWPHRKWQRIGIYGQNSNGQESEEKMLQFSRS